MTGEFTRTQALLRQRARAKRAMPVWLGLAIVWGVVFGWIIWGLVRLDSAGLAWAIYLVPLAVLAGMALATYARIRRIDRELLRVAREEGT
ncbi:MAG: hypothetical protein Q7V58_05900 [Actinomycetota bacterium]|nr:hypothetical protein [Actinomycetota bacterium]